MSLVDRSTSDYSPLRGPVLDARGRDMRPRHERQKYEAAVNARREMLHVLASRPNPKLKKKEYEFMRRRWPKGTNPNVIAALNRTFKEML